MIEKSYTNRSRIGKENENDKINLKNKNMITAIRAKWEDNNRIDLKEIVNTKNFIHSS